MTNTRLKEVSRVQNELRLNNKDSYFSRRTILFMLEDKLKFLISQKNGEKSLYRENQLFAHMSCFELEKIDVIKCGIVEFRTCKTLMKSKERLPETVDSKYFNNILNVTSIDTGSIFSPLTVREYAQSKRRKYAHIERLTYYIIDGYLYIPDYEVYAVDLDILTLRVEETVKKSACSKEDCCKSYWDYPLISSDRLAEAAVREVIQELVGTVKSIPPDENPNLDENIKSKTTN